MPNLWAEREHPEEALKTLLQKRTAYRSPDALSRQLDSTFDELLKCLPSAPMLKTIQRELKTNPGGEAALVEFIAPVETTTVSSRGHLQLSDNPRDSDAPVRLQSPPS